MDRTTPRAVRSPLPTAAVCSPHRPRTPGPTEECRMRIALLAAVAVLCVGCSKAQPDNIPRTSDGKPDLTGVWAGPGFKHTGKDTDSATVRLYTDANMPSFTPEGKSLFFRPHTGNARVDDLTAVSL